MIFTPILFLVCINIFRCGVFDGFRDDVISAFQDLSAFLLNRREPEPMARKRPKQSPPDSSPPSSPPDGTG